MKTEKLRTTLGCVAASLMLAAPLALYGCGGAPAESNETQEQSQEQAAQTNDAKTDEKSASDNGSGATPDKETTSKTSTDDERLDTLVLVNKKYALPDGWEKKLELKGDTNIKGDYIEVDKIAYDAFVDLQKDLEKNEGITIQLNSGYRSIAEQQRIWDEFMAEYGEDYVLEFVAEPGHSEHHTGLALDALLVEDGVPIVTNEEIFAHQDTWDVIHSYLAKHGFILRYLDGEEAITGYTYEPWHLRYVGEDAATEIAKKGITLEEYLGKA